MTSLTDKAGANCASRVEIVAGAVIERQCMVLVFRAYILGERELFGIRVCSWLET